MKEITQFDRDNWEVVDGTEGGRSPTGVPSTTSAAVVTAGPKLPPVATPSGGPIPDPAVPERPARRRFTAEYKARILREADRTEPGRLGALLRREGLYSSHLVCWRRQREAGALAGLTPKPRGRRPAAEDPLVAENRRLRSENEQLTVRLRQAETILEVQKKLSETLGLSWTPTEKRETQP